jgi:hypothetical protein
MEISVFGYIKNCGFFNYAEQCIETAPLRPYPQFSTQFYFPLIFLPRSAPIREKNPHNPDPRQLCFAAVQLCFAHPGIL